MLRVEKLFKSDIKITLICRQPGNDEGDTVLTSEDSTLDAIAALQRSHRRELEAKREGGGS